MAIVKISFILYRFLIQTIEFQFTFLELLFPRFRRTFDEVRTVQWAFARVLSVRPQPIVSRKSLKLRHDQVVAEDVATAAELIQPLPPLIDAVLPKQCFTPSKCCWALFWCSLRWPTMSGFCWRFWWATWPAMPHSLRISNGNFSSCKARKFRRWRKRTAAGVWKVRLMRWDWKLAVVTAAALNNWIMNHCNKCRLFNVTTSMVFNQIT